MKIRSIELERSQRGWSCSVCYTVLTRWQFSAEEMVVHSGGRWMWLALWNGLRAARSDAAKHRATPEERKEQGWTT